MSSNQFWTSQLEARLQAWHSLQQLAGQTKAAPCITIAREFGCQGYPLAQRLVDRFNARTAGDPWILIGRQVLDEVAKLSGYTVEQIEKSQDTPPSLKAIFSMFLDRSRAEETEVFTHMRSVIRGFARRGNCVILGRGGVYAAQDLKNCIHVRLVADADFRLEKIMDTYSLSQEEAREHVAAHQKQRDEFIARFTGADITNPRLYHLLLNNSRLDIDKIADVVEEYLMRYTL